MTAVAKPLALPISVQALSSSGTKHQDIKVNDIIDQNAVSNTKDQKKLESIFMKYSGKGMESKLDESGVKTPNKGNVASPKSSDGKATD